MTTEDSIQFGLHFMFDGYGADPDTLKDSTKLTDILRTIPASMGMHAISEPLVVEVGPKNRKDSGGVSGFVMIAESHISFHTFPNRGFITADVYTCQNEIDTDKLTKLFVDSFKITDFETHVLPRGTRYPAEDISK